MQLKKNVTHDDLLAAGFDPVKKAYEEGRDDDTLAFYEYKMELGYSRRGQSYYLLILERTVSIYASKPDGSGAPIELPPCFFTISHLLEGN